MRIEKYEKLSGDDLGDVKCLQCHKKATIEYRLYHYVEGTPWNQLLLCDRCAKSIALGMIRDVAAGIVGEDEARDGYTFLMSLVYSK